MPSTLPSSQSCCDECTGIASVLVASGIGWFRLDDLAQLRAQPSSVTNVFASVGTELAFIGDFFWKNGALDADNDITCIAPSDGGAGRWKKLI